jgi:hypothetical protein
MVNFAQFYRGIDDKVAELRMTIDERSADFQRRAGRAGRNSRYILRRNDRRLCCGRVDCIEAHPRKSEVFPLSLSA